MNIGTNIKSFRVSKGLTQKDLAEKLGVTYQAVSRWENNEVEPSLDIIAKMSEIFNTSIENLILDKNSAKENNDKENKEDVKEQTPAPEPTVIIQKEVIKEVKDKDENPVVGVCYACHKAVREKDKFITNKQGILCDACDKKIKKENLSNEIKYGIKQRHKGYIFGTLIAIICLVISILVPIYYNAGEYEPYLIASCILLPITGFTFTFSAFVKNNFIMELWYTVACWGVVKFPGVIFSLSFDGLAWLIGVKILFGILGFIIGFIFVLFATIICLILSIFVFPYAIIVSYKYPEKTEDF